MHTNLKGRRAGVLLHPTSLPGVHNPAVSGDDARHFIDFLQASGFTLWQTLPLGPTHADNSPYQCLSVHAGNTGLVNLDDLVARGWLKASIRSGQPLQACLNEAHAGFKKAAQPSEINAYNDFRHAHDHWLLDYALYQAIRHTHGDAPWPDWPPALRDRQPQALADFQADNGAQVEQFCFEQFVFFIQWHVLREYAHAHDILLFGDMPIYVAHDSADVWANREIFALDECGAMEVVAGVPPDYFSETGQHWGNPLYRWDVLKQRHYDWWVDRFRTQLALFDIIRLDHFRGFEKYWEIPASAETAIDGRWVDGPGEDLFRTLEAVLGELPLVAEDLGVITPEVTALRLQFGYPGMKILQFAFGSGPDNAYLPHNHEPLSVVYTGTHDNDTTAGWYASCSDELRHEIREYLSQDDSDIPWSLIRAALESAAELAIIPMQDLLALGTEHRMNTPGSVGGNWSWHFEWDMVPGTLSEHLHGLLERAGRVGGRSASTAR